MGISTMLGLAESIGNVIGNLFTTLFKFLVNTLIVPVVQAAIRVIITVIQYFGSTLFYEISKFLLGLIDFVEVLFRSLAGLAPRAGSEFTISFGGESEDLLIQFLTNKEVLSAFYATAIVGMFLLIITTIFQMIKVEYTTEGAQNSKTGIIGKSLKSLSNMLIIPLLCILGVFIGNQVLDLIDTATSGGDGAKISGQLWVAAATTAMIDEDSMTTGTSEYVLNLNEIKNEGGLLSAGISLALQRGFASIFEEELDPIGTKETVETNRSAIEGKFLNGQLSFYDVTTVIKYYNPFEVNYLVLIFGACIIIKCLYYTCFGLIDRLYQCTALFIVMPMVVGMSPVKDSLGSWRSKFMSKALSAYGTVISLNLFFIIVKVMLGLNITITNTGSGASTAGLLKMFPESFMVGLIKSLMVIVGCLMIEKLAGDLGGYFGGGNAMAEGKSLSNDATSGLKKAATFAGGVAMGGIGLMKAGVKTTAGIAGKIGGGVAAAVHKGSEVNANRKVNKMISSGKVNESDMTKYSNAKKNVKSAQETYDNAKKDADQASKDKAKAQKIINSSTASRAEKDAARKAYTEASDRETSAKKIMTSSGGAIKRYNSMISGMESGNKNISKAYGLEQSSSKNHAKVSAYTTARKDEVKNAVSTAGKKLTAAKEGTGQLIHDKFGLEAMFNTFAPKDAQKLKKDYETAQKTAMDASPEGQAIMADLQKAKKDKAEAAFDKRNAGVIEARNLQQTNILMNATNAKLETTNRELNSELQKMKDTLDKLINARENALSKGDQASAAQYQQSIMALQGNMQAKNPKLEFDDNTFKLKNESELKVDFKIDDSFMKKIQAEIKKGAKMDDVMNEIQAEFKKIGLTDKDTLAKIYKALEEIKGGIGK